MKNFVSFLVGAAVGTGVTAYFMRRWCDQRIKEEVQSVKDKWSENAIKPKNDQSDDPIVDTEENTVITEHVDYYATTEEINKMTDIVETEGYKARKEAEREARANAKPYMISEIEYSNGDYEPIDLTYYADNVLVTDDNMEPVEDVEGTVGFNALSHLMKGGPEDDIIYVRNDRLRVDYAVMRDDRQFSSILR